MSAVTTTARQNVLHMYKNMLKMIRFVPAKKRYEMLNQIRGEFRSNATETSPERITEMIKKAQSSLSYIKVITPRTRASGTQDGVTKMVFSGNGSNGSGSDGSGKPTFKPVSNWTGSNIDPDSLAKHNASLKRMGFRDNAHAKGIF